MNNKSIVLSEKDFIEQNGEYVMTAKELGTRLGYKNPTSAIRKIYHRYRSWISPYVRRVKGVGQIGVPLGGNQELLAFSEVGLYFIALKANTAVGNDYALAIAEFVKKIRVVGGEIVNQLTAAREDSLYWRTRFLRSDVENIIRRTKKLNFSVAKIIDRMAERGFSVADIAQLADLRIENARGYLHASLRAEASQKELEARCPSGGNPRVGREYGQLLGRVDTNCAKELYDGIK